MGGSVAHDAVASATGATLSLKRHSMLTWAEKGERLDGEMHSINLFSDAYTAARILLTIRPTIADRDGACVNASTARPGASHDLRWLSRYP